MSSPTSGRQYSDESPSNSGGSVSISSFLTLPRTYQPEHLRLFKAPDSDDRSLTMKKRHHNSHDHGISDDSRKSSVGQNGARAGFTFGRSQSLPFLPIRHRPTYQDTGFVSTGRVSKLQSGNPHGRRWTLPVKAVSTRELSMHSPGDKYRHTRRSGSPRNSPAVITLRRATTSLGQGTSITFFPPPKFNVSKTSLISHFLNTIVGGDREKVQCNESSSTEPRRKFSIFSQSPPHRTMPATNGEVANPTVTKVTFEPTVSVSDSETVPYRSRRCSTKYVTRTSIYEIIWDENDTPTDGSEMSSPPGIPDLDVRRPSIAATHLEAQLYKSVEQSRRASHVLMLGDERGFGAYQGRRLSFQSLLNTSLSRLINESALQRLPRSHTSGDKPGRGIQTSPNDKIHPNTPIVETPSRHRQVEVFPPIQRPRHEARSSLGAAESRKAPEVEGGCLWAGDACPTRQAKGAGERMGTNSTVMGDASDRGRAKVSVTPMRRRRNNETAPFLDVHIWETHHPW